MAKILLTGILEKNVLIFMFNFRSKVQLQNYLQTTDYLQITEYSHITRYLQIINYLQIKNYLQIANYLHISYLFTQHFKRQITSSKGISI